MKTIYCIVGQSAAGKDTIAERVSKDLCIPRVISFTTRQKRDGESDDKHIFIDENRFEKLKEAATFAAYTQIGDYHYFTTRLQIETLFENHDAILYVIDPNGIESLKKVMTDVNIVSIYINVPRETRYKRAQSRGDNMIAIHTRSVDEFPQFVTWLRRAEFDYAVKNDNIDTACHIVESIISIEEARNENPD